MKKKKVIMTISIIVIVILLAIMILPRYMVQKVEDVAEVPPVVSVVKPEVRTIELTSEVMGTIEPDNLVYIIPKGAGELTSVHVKTGDMVQAGQLLATIDTKQVDSAKISMETAKVSMQQAQDSLARLTPLHAAGAVSDQDLKNAQDGERMSRLQYENARLAYNIQLENSQVTAPISGRVESFNVEVHDMVSQQSQICVITGEGGKAAVFYVSERVAEGLSVGDSLKIEKNGSEYQGAITEVSNMVDSTTGLFKVKASVTGADALAAGSSVKLYLVSKKAENVLTVPADSVYYEGGIPFIYTYADGKVQKNEVTVGLGDSQHIEVQSGIHADTQVINTWTTELYEGSRVTLAEENSVEEASSVEEEELPASDESSVTEE